MSGSCRDSTWLLAWGRDYVDVPPIKGVAAGGVGHVVEVAVDVVPVAPVSDSDAIGYFPDDRSKLS